jgi:acyl CoA:acetate/3-ketoacid CoA transferase
MFFFGTNFALYSRSCNFVLYYLNNMDLSFVGFNEYFRYGESNLSMFLDYPFRLEGGFVFFCNQGEACICTGVQEHHIEKNSEMFRQFHGN